MKRKINISEDQLTLPFGQMSARAISFDDRTKAFWFMTSVCLLSLGVYVYAINSTARNVAMRAELERSAAEISAELATLEFQYIALKDDVTIELAHVYGFQEVKEPLYVSRGGEKNSLSFNTQTR